MASNGQPNPHRALLASQLARISLKSRGSSLSIVLTVAIGVGALTIAFGLADAAIWRQPPLADAAHLVVINSTHTRAGRPEQRARWSYQRIQLMRKGATSFAQLANFTTSTLTLTGRDEAERVNGEIVSPDYFSMLEGRAERGRVFVASDDQLGTAQPIVLLGHTLWERQFASDASIVGKTVGINGHALTVIGVMPASFTGLSGKSQLWIPTVIAPTLSYPEYLTTDQNFINVVARLKSEVSLARASGEMHQLSVQIFKAIPVVMPIRGLSRTLQCKL